MILQDKVAIVTGGSRGIGAATSALLAGFGAKVVVNYLSNHEAANRVVDHIITQGGQAIAVKADVLDERQIEDMVSQTVNTYGRVDILVNNAYIPWTPKTFLEMQWEDFSERLQGELKAAFALTKAVLPSMLEQQYGRIVYVGSAHSRGPIRQGAIAYGTSKAGLVAFSKYIASEFGPNGITANVVSPGMVITDQNRHLPQEFKDKIASSTPLRRVGQPEDIAKVIAFYASDLSQFVTGIDTPVNGGMFMN